IEPKIPLEYRTCPGKCEHRICDTFGAAPQVKGIEVLNKLERRQCTFRSVHFTGYEYSIFVNNGLLVVSCLGCQVGVDDKMACGGHHLRITCESPYRLFDGIGSKHHISINLKDKITGDEINTGVDCCCPTMECVVIAL